jgi:hypothetical protein
MSRTRSTMPIANRPMRAIVPPAAPAPAPAPFTSGPWHGSGAVDVGAPWDGVARPRTLTERIPLEKGWAL